MNSFELFDQLDKNNDEAIQIEEWIEFWTIVMNSGYSEEEVSLELDNMMKGGSWVKFQTKEKIGTYKQAEKMKKEGKC